MIYVVGKNGYIASNLIPYLREKGYEVVGYGRDHDFTLDRNAEHTIINCASYGNKPGQTDIAEMIISNFSIPEQCCGMDNLKLIQLSSSSEIFQPHTAYARTKSLASDYLRGKATLCYIYTAWGGINQHPHTFMAALLKAKREGTPMHLTTPYATRDFVHIKHVCRGIEELITKPIGEYHFGMGKARIMIDVARMAGVEHTVDKNYDLLTWKAADPYFPDTFEEDLQWELQLCEL